VGDSFREGASAGSDHRKRLRILLADDQRSEIADAERVLLDSGHAVEVVTSFTDAEAKLRDRSTPYDVVLIDLGWFTDPTCDRDDKDTAGWDLDALAAESDALRVLYSTRLDDPGIQTEADQRGMLPVRKSWNEASRKHLADLLSVVAHYRRFALRTGEAGRLAAADRNRLSKELGGGTG
jgi:CheY-like chemotaxis protein